jgi:hypothetical protein
MNWGVVGLLIVFGAFIVLLLRNPRMTCFGRKLKSPFYPLFRRRKMEQEAERLRRDRLRKIPTEDYGFRLGGEEDAARPAASEEAKKKADPYGFKLD